MLLFCRFLLVKGSCSSAIKRRQKNPRPRGLVRGEGRMSASHLLRSGCLRRRSIIHRPAGRAVKSATRARRKAALVTSPNCLSGGKLEKESARKPAALIKVEIGRASCRERV